MASDWSSLRSFVEGLLEICRHLCEGGVSSNIYTSSQFKGCPILENQSINCQRYEEFNDLLVLARHSHAENSNVSLAINDNP
jgi:hypothetical protein